MHRLWGPLPLLAFFICLHAVTVYALPCQPGWRYFEQTNSCYRPLPGQLPWTVGEFRCLFMGGHQASITSQQENDFVHGLVSYREMFTGGAYFGSNPVYVNSDGRPFSNFENWEDGSRPAMNRARRCIKVNEYGKWFQSCCKQYGATVCKKPSPQPVAGEPQPQPAPVYPRYYSQSYSTRESSIRARPAAEPAPAAKEEQARNNQVIETGYRPQTTTSTRTPWTTRYTTTISPSTTSRTTTTPRPRTTTLYPWTSTYALDPAWTRTYKHKYYWKPSNDYRKW